jgi:hypothetical protein
MTHSKTHKRFSERLYQPDALTDPEKYLGPNWEDVLNFWIYLDTFSVLEMKEISDRYWALDYHARNYAWGAAIDAAEEVVGEKFRIAAWYAAWDVTGESVFGTATYELIAHHKLLEQEKIPIFLPLCTTTHKKA